MTDLKIQRYHVLVGVSSLAAAGGLLPPGGIIVARNSVSILGCPACGKMQFVAGVPTGPAEAPHLQRPVQCGSGYCKRCGVWFRILNGAPEILPNQVRAAAVVPARLAQAGVRRPPQDPVEGENA
jgi:uncharacterized protein YbaR (Trm112 family)